MQYEVWQSRASNCETNCMALLRIRDARYFQIFFQSIFLLYGIYFLQWNTEHWLYLVFFSTAIFSQILIEALIQWRKGNKLDHVWWHHVQRGIPSATISAFGLSLFLKTNEPLIAVMAAFAGIGSKYILRFRGKHIFNPSALGIVLAVWVSGHAWVNPGQWGSGMMQLFGGLILGYIVVTRVQKLDISLAFLLTFIGLLFIRQVSYLGWPLDFFIQSVSTGTVLVFSFFMISDPKTTPDHPVARVIWGMLVAILAFYFVSFRYVNGAPVLALVILQPLVPLLDLLFRARRFEWNPSGNISPSHIIG